ncbi:MAG: glycoside hydrolase family 16 protein [Methanosarcinaceae archaeon]
MSIAFYFSSFGLAQSPDDDLTWDEIITKSDEFGGSSVNTSKWEVMDFWAPWGQGYFDPDYVTVENGYLDLSVEKIDTTYYHGGIKSQDQDDQMQFGYLEIRAKIPIGKGFWPTFWLYNASCSGEWYDEIDIVEPAFSSHFQEMNQINWHEFTIVDDTCTHYGLGNYELDLRGDNINTTYHKYAVEWLPNHMVFYYDDEPWFNVFNNTTIPTHGIDDLDGVDGLSVYCDLQINKEGENPPDSYTDLSQTYRVDYIKFYELDETSINSTVTVTSSNLSLSSVYKTINFQSGLSIPSTSHLTYRATDYIHIADDFTAPLGSTLVLYFYDKQ